MSTPSGRRCARVSPVYWNSRASTSSVSSASRRVAMAVDCAARRPEASARALAFKSAAEAPRPEKPRTSASATPAITRTTVSSSSVKPLVDEILVLTFAAFLAVRAQREDVERLVVLAGRGVAEVVAPRVLQHRGILEVRSVPFLHPARLL